MGARRTAKIALDLVMDLAERLAAAGVPVSKCPSFEEAVDLVWPLARQLARQHKGQQDAVAAADGAREAMLGRAVALWTAAPWWRWPELDPSAWHAGLVPGPERVLDRQVIA